MFICLFVWSPMFVLDSVWAEVSLSAFKWFIVKSSWKTFLYHHWNLLIASLFHSCAFSGLALEFAKADENENVEPLVQNLFRISGRWQLSIKASLRPSEHGAMCGCTGLPAFTHLRQDAFPPDLVNSVQRTFLQFQKGWSSSEWDDARWHTYGHLFSVVVMYQCVMICVIVM